MKKIFAIVILSMFGLTFISACSKSEQAKNEAADQDAVGQKHVSRMKSSMPLTKIKTFEDYDKVKMEAYSEYDRIKMAAYGEYDRRKMKAYDIYDAFEKSELKKVRNSDMGTYLMWLDADKLGDYNEKLSIEKYSPAISAYISKTCEKYAEYQKKDAEAYKEYQEIDAIEYAMYEQIDASAYKAYEENKDKK